MHHIVHSTPFIMNIFTKWKVTAFTVYVSIVLLTIIIHAYDASGCTAAIIVISTEETYGLSVRRKLPFLAHILLSIFLITRHLSQHMMYDAGFFLHTRIWFNICCNLLSCAKKTWQYDNFIIFITNIIIIISSNSGITVVDKIFHHSRLWLWGR